MQKWSKRYLGLGLVGLGLGLELGLVASVHRRTRYNTEFFTGAENAKRDSTGTEK